MVRMLGAVFRHLSIDLSAISQHRLLSLSKRPSQVQTCKFRALFLSTRELSRLPQARGYELHGARHLARFPRDIASMRLVVFIKSFGGWKYFVTQFHISKLMICFMCGVSTVRSLYVALAQKAIWPF